jgi:hypothetical protein
MCTWTIQEVSEEAGREGTGSEEGGRAEMGRAERGESMGRKGAREREE